MKFTQAKLKEEWLKIESLANNFDKILEQCDLILLDHKSEYFHLCLAIELCVLFLIRSGGLVEMTPDNIRIESNKDNQYSIDIYWLKEKKNIHFTI
jgi:hypothetical protein